MPRKPLRRQSEKQKKAFAASRTEGKAKHADGAEKTALAKNQSDLRRKGFLDTSKAPPLLAELYKVPNTCGCARCSALPPGDGLTITKAVLSNSALRLKANMIAELKEHGVPLPADLKVLKAFAVEHLVQKGAFLLTEPVEKAAVVKAKRTAEETAPAEPQPKRRKGSKATAVAPAEPAPEPATAEPAISPARVARKPRGYSSPATSGLVASSPAAAQSETREGREARRLSLPKSTDAEVVKSVVAAAAEPGATKPKQLHSARYRLAFKLVATENTFTYTKYKTAVCCDQNEPLSAADFCRVQRVAFTVSQRLVERALEAGVRASTVRLRLMLKGQDKNLFKEMFPHGISRKFLIALGADACWPTPGFTSRHGTVHFVDLATGCIVAVAHVTKDGAKGPDHEVLSQWAATVKLGHKGSSGGMDQVGTEMCAAWLTSRFPEGFQYVVLCRDGDVKAVKASALGVACARWEDARCKCHIGKNLRKWLAKELSKLNCEGGCSPACKANRADKQLPNRASGRFYTILHQATFLWLPEIDDPALLATLKPADLLSPKRVADRAAALEFATRELRAMVRHFAGDCTWCLHGDLPAGRGKLACPAQIAALAKQVDSIIAELPSILSPFGPLDINGPESNHSVFRDFRPKGDAWTPVACFLAENMAILEVQALKLHGIAAPGGDELLAAPLAFAAEVKALLGLDVAYTSRDLRKMDKRLRDRLTQKRYRDSPKGKATRVAWRKKSRTSQAVQAGGAGEYVSGGGAAAAEADDAGVRLLREKDWCGEGGLMAAEEAALVGEGSEEPDYAQSEQRASVMTGDESGEAQGQ